MKLIKVENRIAIPIVKIDYVEIDEDEGCVTIVSNGTHHDFYSKTTVATRNFYESIIESMEY